MNGTELKVQFEQEWGLFRRFIAANPLTGFWIGVAIGFSVGFIVGKII